jgi:hypothetical protein
VRNPRHISGSTRDGDGMNTSIRRPVFGCSRESQHCAGVSFLSIVLSIPLTWLVFAADSPVDLRPSTPNKPTKFQFARTRYPGGIPGYVKNWYTDYPNMDNNLTALTGRLTGIDVGPPVVVFSSTDPESDTRRIFGGIRSLSSPLSLFP